MGVQPSQQVLTPGIDPTGFASISGAQLLQLVSGAVFVNGKGGVLYTFDDVNGNPTVPNAVGTVGWQSYIWARVGAAKTSLYLWNPNISQDPTYQFWQNFTISSIPAQSIVAAMIANGTITDTQMHDIGLAKVIPSLVDSNNNSTANDVVVVNANATGLSYASPLTIGRILQQTRITSGGSSTGNNATRFAYTTAPLFTQGDPIPEFSNVLFTPKSINSSVSVKVFAPVVAYTGNDYVVLALFKGLANQAVAAALGWCPGATTHYPATPLHIYYTFNPGSLAQIRFDVRFGAAANNSAAGLGTTTGADNVFGGAVTGFGCWMEITEYL